MKERGYGRGWDLPGGFKVLDEGEVVCAERIGKPMRLVGEAKAKVGCL